MSRNDWHLPPHSTNDTCKKTTGQCSTETTETEDFEIFEKNTWKQTETCMFSVMRKKF